MKEKAPENSLLVKRPKENLEVPEGLVAFKNKRFFLLGGVGVFLLLFVLFLGLKDLKKGLLKFGQKSSGLAWCQSGQKLILKGATLTAIGIENYQSQKLEAKVCHLSLTDDYLTTDFYLDGPALERFQSKESKEGGNGCLVFQIRNFGEKTEVCFGEKVKSFQVERGEEEVDLLKELGIEVSPVEATREPQIFLKITPRNLAGTKWDYQIQVGGGVGGRMTFDKDEDGEVGGFYTESGPGGKEEKKFSGRDEGGKLLLILGDFPEFTLVFSDNGKTLTGKPTKPTKDIFYPEDFFKASLAE
jgi:hypothetical protein